MLKLLKRISGRIAAHILPKTRKVDHITPVLRSLHWPSVKELRIIQIMLFVYKALNSFGYVMNHLDQVRQHSVCMHHISGTNLQKIAGLLQLLVLLTQGLRLFLFAFDQYKHNSFVFLHSLCTAFLSHL